jgi:hypothetical protein
MTSWRGTAAHLTDQTARRAQDRPAARRNEEGEGRARAWTNCGTTRSSETTASALSDLGVSKYQSSKWQQLADVPDDDFEAALAEPAKPTTTGTLEPRTCALISSGFPCAIPRRSISRSIS